jgi:hypothetical protein
MDRLDTNRTIPQPLEDAGLWSRAGRGALESLGILPELCPESHCALEGITGLRA